jgi:hypothetical protein
MDDLPVLNAKEQADLLAALERAQTEIRAGKATDYEPTRFRDRLVRIYRGKRP